MASGLPVVCSDIRGSRDLMEPETQNSQVVNPQSASLQPCKGGYMISKANDVNAYAEAIAQISKKSSLHGFHEQANAPGPGNFSMEQVSARMENIYQRISHKK